jgi:type II restriction/modification system DNA methylase subunit YeeA
VEEPQNYHGKDNRKNMNTKNLKAYAPKARSQFIEAIKKRAAQLGIYQDKIADVQFEGGAAIIEGRAFTKKQGEQRKALERKIEEKSLATHKERYDLFIREMAYTWFNRLAAIRYMELHDYLDHGFRVLSNPNSADSLPEILDHASDVVDTLDPDQKYLDKNHIIELQLAGNKEEELYRELLLGQCHRLYNIMPFMFEAIDDATELLLPDNLTKTDSILKGLVNEIPEEDWSEIEVIGWLYQFYISEHKDSVIGKLVKSEDIPAATQLFTPNWIVKYLVHNSLGRQWIDTYPKSELKDKVEYYIESAQQSDDVITQLKAITPTNIDPEQIKVLDPAAGSGHILMEVYEVLREIYLERGYRLREIPELILTKNIYGLDIDDRAAQLAGFALMMKAREDDRRIFQRVEDGEVALNVYSLQSTEGLDIGKLWQALNLEGIQQRGSTVGLFDALGDDADGFIQPTGIYKEYFELLHILKSAFLQAKTLGSLILIDNVYLTNLVALKKLVENRGDGSDPSAKQAAIELLPIINQSIILTKKYSIVVANPPYLMASYQEDALKKHIAENFPNSKSDLYGTFFQRSLMFCSDNGLISLMTPFTWLSIKQFGELRKDICENNDLISLVVPEYHAFYDSAHVPICACSIRKKSVGLKGVFVDLNEFFGAELQPLKYLDAVKNHSCAYRYERSAKDFLSMPNYSLLFDMDNSLFEAFEAHNDLGSDSDISEGIKTGDNDLYLRYWHEVSDSHICKSTEDSNKWRFHHKGGEYRRWYGNLDYVVNWDNNGSELKQSKRSGLQGLKNYNNEGITWSKISSTYFGVRYLPEHVFFDSASPAVFPHVKEETLLYLSFLSSNVASYIVKKLNPTMNTQVGNVASLPAFPIIRNVKYKAEQIATECLAIAKKSWDGRENSNDFTKHPLVEREGNKLSENYSNWIFNENENLNKLEELEFENNKLYIELFDLKDNLVPIIPKKQLTLFSNVSHRFDNKLSHDVANERLLSITICELISYSIANMMGRYSLDREGLVYAHSANEGFKELVSKGAYQTFPADDDGIVPLASEDWLFGDDATARFREFVKTVWGEGNLQENLEFVAESLCLHALKPVKGESANGTVRRYFSKQFYKDHCKTYKKRPIYWLFSSGKEKAFECLVYLHRYNEGTLSRMRTEYVTPLMGKYEAQHSLLAEQKIEATTTETRRIEKELKSLDKKQAELRTFDEQLKHCAEMRITLDLDDGVKANYGKFGNLLADVKAIHGKAVK